MIRVHVKEDPCRTKESNRLGKLGKWRNGRYVMKHSRQLAKSTSRASLSDITIEKHQDRTGKEVNGSGDPGYPMKAGREGQRDVVGRGRKYSYE
jgi:hypothetical protein